MTLRAIKANHGDSLLLLGGGAQVLIDGGPSGVYRAALRDQLLDLGRDGPAPPNLDLLIVSHIDADHIAGVLDLTDELIEARDESRTPIVTIERAWHNSFSDTIARAGVQKDSEVATSAASLASAFDSLSGLRFDPRESKLVLSSVRQGRRLREDLAKLNVDLNRRFPGKMVLGAGASGQHSIGDLNFTVIGPTQKEVDRLREEWKRHLKTILGKEEAAARVSAMSLDTSVSNLASIVVIAERGGKTALLTGDARGDMILNWMESSGRLQPGKSIHFDIVKLPHHGSDRNVTPEFFRRVKADDYVISGNGGHGNPEPHTLEMLFEARPLLDYRIHLTYSPEEIKAHKKFQKEGNVPKWEAVFKDQKRRNLLRVPAAGDKHIDVPF